MIKCKFCNIQKEYEELSFININSHYIPICVECIKQILLQKGNKITIEEYENDKKQKVIQYNREYKIKNKEKQLEYQKKFRENHKETIKKQREKDNIKNKEYQKIYRENHKEYFCNYQKEHYIPKPKKIKIKTIKVKKEKEVKKKPNKELNKLKARVRCLINKSFVRKGYKKNTKTQKIIGCDFQKLNEHLLRTYKNNYGIEWDGIESIHIDHIIPLANAQTEDEVIKLCHYTNLQLLKAKDNLKKAAKLT